MKTSLVLTCIILGTFVIIDVSCRGTMNRRGTSYDDGVLCSLSATKRMLKGLRITSSTKCLLNSKRDIANLVSTYLNVATSRDSRKRNEKKNFYNTLDDVIEGKVNSKRALNYCCSPDCDPFMETLGRPDKNIIACE